MSVYHERVQPDVGFAEPFPVVVNHHPIERNGQLRSSEDAEAAPTTRAEVVFEPGLGGLIERVDLLKQPWRVVQRLSLRCFKLVRLLSFRAWDVANRPAALFRVRVPTLPLRRTSAPHGFAAGLQGGQEPLALGLRGGLRIGYPWVGSPACAHLRVQRWRDEHEPRARVPELRRSVRASAQRRRLLLARVPAAGLQEPPCYGYV